MTSSADREKHVVIVGAGPTGVAQFQSLVHAGGADRITLVDSNPIGLGQAFGEKFAGDPAFISNSPIAATWVDPSRPDGLLEYMLDRGWPVAATDFMPRIVFGQYCRQVYLDAREVALRDACAVDEARARATRIERDGPRYRVELDDGSVLDASDVVLCIGIEKPVLPPVLEQFRDDERLIVGAYPAERLRALPPASRVLLVGLRASGRDAMLALARAGHSIVMTSPSGALSAVRWGYGSTKAVYFDRDEIAALDPNDEGYRATIGAILIRAAEKAGEGRPIAEQLPTATDPLEWFQESIALAVANKSAWPDLMSDAIDVLNTVASQWPPEVRAKVLGPAAGFMARYVNSMPLLLAQKLDQLFQSGVADLSREFFSTVGSNGAGWDITWASGKVEQFDYIVVTAGYYFPRYALDGPDAISVLDTASVAGRELAVVTPDLRMSFGPGRDPERIWVVGPGSNVVRPVAHLINIAARDTPAIADRILAGAQRTEKAS